MVDKKAHIRIGKETSHRCGGSVRHRSCREEEPETATHSLLMISSRESGIRSCQLKAQEALFGLSLGNGLSTHVNSKGKSPLPENFSPEEDRTHEAAPNRTESLTHYQLSYSGPTQGVRQWSSTAT